MLIPCALRRASPGLFPGLLGAGETTEGAPRWVLPRILVLWSVLAACLALGTPGPRVWWASAGWYSPWLLDREVGSERLES